MLAIPTPFPNQGSYALLDVDGETTAVRIISRNDDDTATISVVGTSGASGNKTVPFSSLIDGTELTDTERDEMKALSSAKTGKKATRYAALRLRDIHSTVLDAALAVASRRKAA